SAVRSCCVPPATCTVIGVARRGRRGAGGRPGTSGRPPARAGPAAAPGPPCGVRVAVSGAGCAVMVLGPGSVRGSAARVVLAVLRPVGVLVRPGALLEVRVVGVLVLLPVEFLVLVVVVVRHVVHLSGNGPRGRAPQFFCP